MEQKARVSQTHPNGTATVVIVRESACSGDCHKCSGCGAAKETLLIQAVNAVQATPGDVVIVRSETAPVLKAAVMLYIVPMLLFFLGYYLGDRFLGLGSLIACLSFAAGIVLTVLYDRLVVKKQKPAYTITGFVK